MHQISISDLAYLRAQRAATASGLTLAAYLESLISEDASIEPQGLETFYTDERLAIIDAAAADVEAGNHCTSDEIREMIRQKHDAWLQTHPR